MQTRRKSESRSNSPSISPAKKNKKSFPIPKLTEPISDNEEAKIIDTAIKINKIRQRSVLNLD